MKSSKVKTQKNISILLGITLAVMTLFSSATSTAHQPVDVESKSLEAKLIAEIEQMFLEEAEEISLIEEIENEEFIYDVKVFGENDELLGEGNIQDSKSLQTLVNKAESIGQFAGKEYYRIVK